MAWSQGAGVEPMMAVNLGTRGVAGRRDLLEYCNHPGGTELSDLRRAHGAEGAARHQAVVPGQRDGRPVADRPQDRRRVRPPRRRGGPRDAAIDPSIELVACGSSNRRMPTFATWEATVLGSTYERGRLHLAAHLLRPSRRRPGELPGRGTDMDRVISRGRRDRGPRRRAAGTSASSRSSFDEWNVWYQSRFHGEDRPGWAEAPAADRGQLHRRRRGGRRRAC